jgi:hypothetical protein
VTTSNVRAKSAGCATSALYTFASSRSPHETLMGGSSLLVALLLPGWLLVGAS